MCLFLQNSTNAAEKISALAKSIFSESSEADSESATPLSKKRGKKNQPSSKVGTKKGSTTATPLAKRGASKAKTAAATAVIKTEVTTFGNAKISSDVNKSPEKSAGRGRPPKKSAAKMAAEAASKKVSENKYN